MDPRTQSILHAAICEFIETGEPVSSGQLFENYNFGIKPAMIRLILNDLEEEGFLEQPHHSAGRVPSDAGLEFFAHRFLEKPAPSRSQSSATSLRKLCHEGAWSEFLGELSSELHLLSVAADAASESVHKMGLEALMDSLDWENKDEVRAVIRDFEEMDARLARISETIAEGPHVFIGKKSPVTRSEQLSVVGGNYRIGDGLVSIFVIGPRRMDYEKAIQILRIL